MILRSLVDDDLSSGVPERAFAAAEGEPLSSLSAERYRADLARRMFRPEWTWIAEEDGRIVAWAVWWGKPDGTRALMLDRLWADASAGDRAELAARLLDLAHQRFVAGGELAPEVFRMGLPNDWRADPEVTASVAWRQDAAAAIGFTHAVERLQFEWTPEAGVPEPDDSLVFRAEPDDEKMLEIFRRIGDGSLDDETRKNRTRTSPEQTARHEMDFYLGAPGSRDWWRTAHRADGTLVGLAVPSATSYGPNVGYLGVLPEFRGLGYVRHILDEITRSHAGRGAERITATTDMGNFPMAAAFRKASYRNIETRMLLSAP